MRIVDESRYNMRIYLNRNWDFNGEKVTIPHTCRETPFHYFDERIYQHNSAYRRVILPEKHWKEKRINL